MTHVPLIKTFSMQHVSTLVIYSVASWTTSCEIISYFRVWLQPVWDGRQQTSSPGIHWGGAVQEAKAEHPRAGFQTVLQRGAGLQGRLWGLWHDKIIFGSFSPQVFDKNSSGRISLVELGELMANMGKSVPSMVRNRGSLQFELQYWVLVIHIHGQL